MTIDKKYNPRCFFDVEIAGQPAGRVVFELFAKVCPVTCENFRALCTGECGVGKTTGKPLHYKGVKFHRVIKSFMIQGGDFSVGNGSGGESIYGGTFKDECFDVKHDRPYLLSMANRGKDTNGSQFFITTQQTPHLDGVHVVFGQVIKGEEVVKEVENQPTDNNSCPLRPVTIANCGELVLKRKQKGKRRKKFGSASSEAESLASSPEKAEKKHKKHHKHKRSSKKEKHKRRDDSPEKEAVDLDGDHSLIKPEEIPEVPANNFLMRRVPTDADTNYTVPERRMGGYYSRRPKVSRSGRKIKGRGFMRYRTPSPEGGRSGSETPPHWKQAQSRMKPLKDYMELAEEVEGDEEGDVAEPVDPVQRDGKPRSSENTERRRERRRDRGDRGDRDYPRGRRNDREASRKHQDENHPPTDQPRRQRRFEENPRRGNRDLEEKERHRSRSRDRDRPPRGNSSRQHNREHPEGKADKDSATREKRHDHQRKSPSKVSSTHNGEPASSAHSAPPSSGKGSAPVGAHKDKRGLSATPAVTPQPPSKAPRRFEEHPHGGDDSDTVAGGALRTRLPMTQLLDPTEPLPPGVEPDEVTSCLNTPGSLPSSQMKWGMLAQGGGATSSAAQAPVSDPKTNKSSSPLGTKAPVESRHSRPPAPVQAETRKNLAVAPPVLAEPGRTTQSAAALRASERQLGLNQKTAPSQQVPAPSAISSASENSNAKILGETSGRPARAKDARSRSRSRGHGRNRSRSGSGTRRRRRRSSSTQARKRNRSASSSSSAGSRRRGRGGAKGRRDSSEESRGKGRRSGRGRQGGRRRSSSSSSKSSSSSSSSSSARVRGGRGGRKKKGSTRAARGGRRRRRSSSSSSSSSD